MRPGRIESTKSHMGLFTLFFSGKIWIFSILEVSVKILVRPNNRRVKSVITHHLRFMIYCQIH